MVDFDKYRDANLSAFELTGGAAHGGLTVRDYFAAKTMAGLLASPRSPNAENPKADVTTDLIANLSYRMADAMMKEREKPVQKATPSVEEAFGLDK